MTCKHCLFLVFLFLLHGIACGQDEEYIVSRVAFSSGLHDEFSPVFYKDGIVFCSNQKDNSLVTYNTGQKGLFKIFYTTEKGRAGWKYPVIFSEDITTDCNEGPVTFDYGKDIMYFARNNKTERSFRNVSDTANKLGIYSAAFMNGTWTGIEPFAYNDPDYSFSTPALTPDGNRLYFSSDMPGGYGGMDLYYCDWKNNAWDRPVNLGPVVNTTGNESFPFADLYGKIYFASDGHGGYGGKDLFFTLEKNGLWMPPVHFEAPINSEADDFGLVTDSTFQSGYFSSNRNRTDDIFSFAAAPVTFGQCGIQSENNYCFTFYDEQYELIDTIPVRYEWDFGDSIIRLGKEVKHCFPGPGEYLVRLTIIDELTGEAIADHVGYSVNLEAIEQACIKSYNVGIEGDTMVFDANDSYLKNATITDYMWDFGEGFERGGPIMTKTFEKKGENMVRLGLLVQDNTGVSSKVCVMKKISIHKSLQEPETGVGGMYGANNSDTAGEKGVMALQFRIGMMDDLSERQKNAIGGLMNDPGSRTMRFDRSGIEPVTYPLLDEIGDFLKMHPDIRLEMVFHTAEKDTAYDTWETAEQLAREVAFYLRNSEVELTSYACMDFHSIRPLIHQDMLAGNQAGDMVELLFMNNGAE